MKYYYGNDWKEALTNPPVEITDVETLRQYEEYYNVVLPANEVEDEDEDTEMPVEFEEEEW